ncbi:MAG: SBBP repeat-containing protein [Methylococcales bacterium]
MLHVEYTQGNESNQPPTVDVGPDQAITLPDGVANVEVNLDGTVNDDGLPNPVTTLWSMQSGPGTVSFGDSSAVDTTATFDLAGTYVLRLTVDDGELSSFDELTVTVNSAGVSTILDVRISASSDDAEEDIATGRLNRGSSDLELVDQGSLFQVVGMRFNDLTIPEGATITNASIQFQTDETHSGVTNLQLVGEAADNALTFHNVNGKITSRVRTAATVDWAPAPWTTVGEAGPDQQTPDIASIIQEIVGRQGWSSGNSLVVIVTGSGQRVAESYNGDAAAAPLLHVEYTQGTETNQPPRVDAGPDQTIVLPSSVTLDGTVNDDGLPNSFLATTWSKASGPGTVNFADSSAVDTTATFDLAGTYVLQLAVDDGDLSDIDELTVTVNSSGTSAQDLELEWAKRAGGLDADSGNAIAVDGSGNTYVTGSFVGGGGFTDSATFGPDEANETTFTDIDELPNMFVAKYTANGNLVWVKRSDGNTSVSGDDIAVDSSGNTYVTGFFKQSFGSTATFGSGETNETTFSNDIEIPTTREFDNGFTDMFVAKYAADGNLVWVKHAGGMNPDSRSGSIVFSRGVSGSGITMDVSGNVYVLGGFTDSATFGLGETGETTLTSEGFSDIFVAKYTADGDLVWVRRAGGTDFDGGSDIVVDGLGDTYVTGGFRESATFGPEEVGETTLTSDGESDVFVAKYTTDGDLVWVKRAGGAGFTSGSGIAVDDSGNAYVSGSFGVATITGIGGSATFGAGEAGETTLTSDGSRDIFVAKYTVDGDLVWVKRAGGSNSDGGQGIAVDNSDTVYVTGAFFDNATFGLGEPRETTLNSGGRGIVDIFVAKFTADGELISAKRAGGNNIDAGFDIAVDDSGNAYVTGVFTGMAIFGLGEENQTTLITGVGGFRDIFVAKFSNADLVNLPVIVDTRVTASSDDAEENTTTGKVNRDSSDLELVDQGRTNQIAGMRFNGLTIPAGATITNASIQFQTDETHSGATTLLIQGEATDNAPTFTNARANISSRDRTNTAVDWEPVSWITVGEAGSDQQTPDIASVIQEIVNRSGWSSGNSLAIIISGTGTRTAESYNGDAAAAPILHVEYTTGNGTNPPLTEDILLD